MTTILNTIEAPPRYIPNDLRPSLIGLTRARLADALERVGDARGLLHLGRVRRGPQEHEVVPHHVASLGGVAFGDVGVFAGAVVHEHEVRVAALAQLEGLAGTDRDHLHLDAGLRLPGLQQELQQPAVLRAGRGGQTHLDGYIGRLVPAGGDEGGNADEESGGEIGAAGGVHGADGALRPAIPPAGRDQRRPSPFDAMTSKLDHRSTRMAACPGRGSPAARRASRMLRMSG